MRKNYFAHRGVRFGSALLVASLLSACQTMDPAVKRSERAADILVSTRQTMSTGDQTVMQSQTALQTLRTSKGDLRPAFEAFMVNAQAVRKCADGMKKEGEQVRQASAIYLAARQEDISTISNDEMREMAQQRTVRIKQRCEDIKDRYAHVNVAFARYIRNLSDLQTYMASELNYGTLDSSQKWIDEAAASGDLLRSEIRMLAGDIELTSSLLSPVPLAATQWPANLQQADAIAAR